ncbi:hypothetical protein EVA_15917 [gut metagenome]|uniref:Uncharacterized protein n=1 Tax=gut metagenome TaxID=749906 RepID=J9FM32_9ZZZZ
MILLGREDRQKNAVDRVVDIFNYKVWHGVTTLEECQIGV